MGVKGLWKVVEKSGKPVDSNTLKGATVAVDISVWINMATKGMQRKDGERVPNAHLLYLYKRICGMFELKMKPIFIFDGETPSLKKSTNIKRKNIKKQRERERDAKYRSLQKTKLFLKSIEQDSNSTKTNLNLEINRDRDPFDLSLKKYRFGTDSISGDDKF